MAEVDHSMREIWRRTVFVFWQHPILWLPVFVADACGQTLQYLQDFVHAQLVDHLLAQHSVLGGTTGYSISTGDSLFFFVLRTTPGFITICLYTAAFVVVSSMLIGIAQGVGPQVGSAVRSIAAVMKRILGLSLVLLVWYGLGLICFGVLAYFDATWERHHLLTSPPVTYFVSALLGALIAWWIAPMGLRLVRPRDVAPVDRAQLRGARLFSIVAVAVSALFGYLALAGQPHVLAPHPSTGKYHVYWLLASFVSATPYVPLFMALSLIAVPALANLDVLPTSGSSLVEDG